MQVEQEIQQEKSSISLTVRVWYPTRREAEVVFRTLLQASVCKYPLIGKGCANVFTNELIGEGL